MLGYELGANKQWVIVPEQAEIIRYIFDRFVKGQTANKIALELNQMEKFTVNGKKWSAGSILIVLRNEKYVGDIEMQKTITKDFLTHRSSINKGEAPRYYVKNHHVGIIDRVTWDKVQTMLFEKPRADMTKGPGKKKVKSIKGSPFGNLRCGAILENGPDAGKPCGEGFFRTTYTGVANGYSDERSLKATGEDTGEYLEKYTYSYPVWRCKRKVGERDGEPPKNGSPDQKAYCRSKKGCMSDEEKEAANKRCPSERYHECALEQSFMELLYSMKRDFEQHGDASMIVTMFDNAYEQAVRLANNNSISVQRMATVENQIKEMEERLQDAISHQVAALREAALEQNVELNEALSNGEVTIDDIDLDIRSGLTPGSIGVSFYGTETEEGSEAQIYTELVNDLQERLKALQQERQTIEEEQGVLAIMKKNFEYFLACLKELPDTNASGMLLRVNGLDVQGSLLRDVDGKPIEGRVSAVTKGKLKLTPERIAEAPDMLHFEKGIYCAFVESGVLQGDVATYKTNFGVTLTSKGNRRTLDSFMGYKRSDMDGNVVYVDKSKKNNNDRTQYRQRDHHEAIVSREVYNAANHLRASRSYTKKNRPLPVLSVVDDGILRGYVPFDKDWTGFSAEEYREASESVMREKKQDTVEVMNRLDLSGYEVVRAQYFATLQNPAMTISNGKLRFNTACLKKFEDVEYVELLLNSVDRCIAIRPCEKDNPNAIRWGRLKEGRWCASTLGCRGLAKALFDMMEWEEGLKYRFRGQLVGQDDDKLMLFELDEPEMVKVEEIVLPSKEQDEEGKTVKQTIYIFPPEWAGTFGKPITSIAQVGILQQEHYSGNWDVLRPAAEIEEMNTFTADGLNALLHEAEKIMEGWTDTDE